MKDRQPGCPDRKHGFPLGALVCLLLIAGSILTAQVMQGQTRTIDSLRQALPLLQGKQRIDCLNELGFEFSNPYWSESKYIRIDTARIYTMMALRESESLRYDAGIGQALQNLGMIEEENRNFATSETYTRRALPRLQAGGKTAAYHRAIINIGYCQVQQGCYDEALTTLSGQIPYYREVGDSNHVHMIYRMIARTYDKLGYKSKAITYFEQDFIAYRKRNDQISQLFFTSFGAGLYMDAGDTANAIRYFESAAQAARFQQIRPGLHALTESNIFMLRGMYDAAIARLIQSSQQIAGLRRDSLFCKRAIMMNALMLARLYFLKKEYGKVLQVSAEPMQEFMDGNDVENWMATALLRGWSCLETKHYDAARSIAMQVLVQSNSYHARPVMSEAYGMLWQIFDRKHDLRNSYRYHLLHTSLKDSIEKDSYVSRIAAMDLVSRVQAEEATIRNKLNLEKMNQEMKLASAIREKQILFYVFSAACMAGVVIILLIRRNFRLGRRKDQLMQSMAEKNAQLERSRIQQELSDLNSLKSSLEMKALRAQMNPHFIANALTAIGNLIRENDNTRASAYLIKFSRLVRHILQNSESTQIPLSDELQALRLYLDMEILRIGNRFTYELVVDEAIDGERVMVPPLFIQPFVENAIWHGILYKSEQGHLQVRLAKEDANLVCQITDNGIGRARAAMIKQQSGNRHPSMGMRITTERITLLHAHGQSREPVRVRDLLMPDGSPGGTEVTIQIPLTHD